MFFYTKLLFLSIENMFLAICKVPNVLLGRKNYCALLFTTPIVLERIDFWIFVLFSSVFHKKSLSYI